LKIYGTSDLHLLSEHSVFLIFSKTICYRASLVAGLLELFFLAPLTRSLTQTAALIPALSMASPFPLPLPIPTYDEVANPISSPL
jgi:hypothetical protein